MMKLLINMNAKILTSCSLLAIAFGFPAHAAPSLQILNPSSLGSSITITAGQSFSAEIFVSGLTTPLDSFNLAFATLPTGVTLNSFTDEVPSGWVTFSSVAGLEYGAANFNTSGDITPSGELVLANFTTSASTAGGSSLITFTAPGVFQNLNDANGDAMTYSLQSLTLNIQAAPEPSTWMLAGAGIISLLAFTRRFRV